MNIDDKLSQVFDVTPIANKTSVPTEVPVINTHLNDDFDTTRSNLHSLLTQGQEALFHALEVAKQSEHPRAFEVVGGLMKNISDINAQLLELHKKKQSIEAPTKEERQGNTTNNAIFVGSTSDLSKMLNDIRKGK